MYGLRQSAVLVWHFSQWAEKRRRRRAKVNCMSQCPSAPPLWNSDDGMQAERRAPALVGCVLVLLLEYVFELGLGCVSASWNHKMNTGFEEEYIRR